MVVLKGVVTKLHRSMEVEGGNNSAVNTTHVTVFQIDGKPIQMKSRETVLIDEKDKVIVAGKLSNGILNAYAYLNETTGASGDEGKGVLYLFGLVFPLAGLYVITTFSDPFFGIMPMLGGLVFIGVGVRMLYRATLISMAANSLFSKQ